MPLVFASEGFFKMTGYTTRDVFFVTWLTRVWHDPELPLVFASEGFSEMTRYTTWFVTYSFVTLLFLVCDMTPCLSCSPQRASSGWLVHYTTWLRIYLFVAWLTRVWLDSLMPLVFASEGFSKMTGYTTWLIRSWHDSLVRDLAHSSVTCLNVSLCILAYRKHGVSLDAFVRDMTHLCVPWFIVSTCIFVDHKHGAVTWLIRLWHDSLMCDMAHCQHLHSRVSQTWRVTWLIRSWHDSLVCVMNHCQHLHSRIPQTWCVTWLIRSWYDSLVGVMIYCQHMYSRLPRGLFRDYWVHDFLQSTHTPAKLSMKISYKNHFKTLYKCWWETYTTID